MELTTKTSLKSKSVVVLAGGPSTMEHKDFILDYIKKNESILLCANRDYYREIKADYVCVKDAKIIYKLKDVRSDKVVVLKRCTRAIKRVSKKKRTMKTFFSICHNGAPDGAYVESAYLDINKQGQLYVNNLGGAGFMTIGVSSLCLPQTVLIAGMDGWKDPSKSSETMMKYNWKGEKLEVSWGAEGEYKKRLMQKAKYMHNALFPFLIRRGIRIETFKSCPLWGANKEKIGITNIA